MSRLTATDFLIRAVLDESFRELALADPLRAFEGYSLSAEHRDILSHPDERLLGLLGQAIATGHTDDPHPAPAESSEAADEPRPNLPDITLLLRLVPHRGQRPGSEGQVAYKASLHPWPGDQADGQAQGEPPSDAAQQLAWVLRIRPTVVGVETSGMRVTYTASIQPFAGGTEPPDPDPTRAAPTSPWNHHIESSAARAAAEAVRTSDSTGRYEKLLELIQALQAGDDRD